MPSAGGFGQTKDGKIQTEGEKIKKTKKISPPPLFSAKTPSPRNIFQHFPPAVEFRTHKKLKGKFFHFETQTSSKFASGKQITTKSLLLNFLQKKFEFRSATKASKNAS